MQNVRSGTYPEPSKVALTCVQLEPQSQGRRFDLKQPACASVQQLGGHCAPQHRSLRFEQHQTKLNSASTVWRKQIVHHGASSGSDRPVHSRQEPWYWCIWKGTLRVCRESTTTRHQPWRSKKIVSLDASGIHFPEVTSSRGMASLTALVDGYCFVGFHLTLYWTDLAVCR